MATIVEFVALTIISAGMIGGAALGLSGTANAAAQSPDRPRKLR